MKRTWQKKLNQTSLGNHLQKLGSQGDDTSPQVA